MEPRSVKNNPIWSHQVRINSSNFRASYLGELSNHILEVFVQIERKKERKKVGYALKSY